MIEPSGRIVFSVNGVGGVVRTVLSLRATAASRKSVQNRLGVLYKAFKCGVNLEKNYESRLTAPELIHQREIVKHRLSSRAYSETLGLFIGPKVGRTKIMRANCNLYSSQPAISARMRIISDTVTEHVSTFY